MQGRKLAILIGIFVVFGCCIIGVVGGYLAFNQVGQSFSTDQSKAAEVGHKIVDYDLPSGYQETASLDLFYQMVVITNHNDPTEAMIMLMQFPTGMASQEQMEQQMEQSATQQTNRNLECKFVEDNTTTIRGQETTLHIYDCTDKDQGTQVRQVIGVFPGKNGEVILMAMGNVDTWDSGPLNEFLGSIR
jgi:hypothetical protein